MASRRVLVVRRHDKFSSLLEGSGAEVINLELVSTEPVNVPADLTGEVLDEYDGLFFTSPAAAGVFVSQVPAFNGRIYVLGRRARAVLENAGYKVNYQDEANTSRELIESFEISEFDGGRFLYLCGDRSLRSIPELLEGRAVIDELVVYRTVAMRIPRERVGWIRQQLVRSEIDWICFFSPSGVEAFSALFGAFIPENVQIAAIGHTTAAAASAAKLNVQFVSSSAGGAEFAEGLIEKLKSIE